MTVRLITDKEEEKIYPKGIVRVTTSGQYMKISCSFGFSIVIDIENILSGGEDEGRESEAYRSLIEKFRTGNGEFRVTVSGRMMRLLEEIKAMNDQGDHVMEALRLREFLVMLSRQGKEAAVKMPAADNCSPNQARVARSVYSYLMKRMDEHVTIDELAETFVISQTQIKESFRSYYGEPIFAYIRREKIMVAADLLQATGCTVAEAARQCGYSNASKFSEAFRIMMGTTPCKYRQKSSWRKENE